MAQPLAVQFDVPDDLARFHLPEAVDRRLQRLLGKQDQTGTLTDDERAEAEGLVELAEFLTLLRLSAERASLDAAQAG